jgi:hypothetical protein
MTKNKLAELMAQRDALNKQIERMTNETLMSCRRELEQHCMDHYGLSLAKIFFASYHGKKRGPRKQQLSVTVKT